MESNAPLQGTALPACDGLSLSLLEAAGPGRPVAFIHENIVKPIINHAAVEPFNAAAGMLKAGNRSLVGKLEEFEVQPAAFLSSAWFAQTAAAGIGMMVPYAVTGVLVGGGFRRFGAAIGAEGRAAHLLKNQALANIGGAVLYDGLRPVRPGETTAGNMAAGAAAFTVFAAGNHWGRNLTGPWKFAGRALTGMVGADTQLLVSRYAAAGSLPAREEVVQAAVAGMFMNNLLPPVQDAMSRSLSEARFHAGFSTPADVYARTRFGPELARMPELVRVLEQNPWARVQRGEHNDFSCRGHGTVKLQAGRAGAEELARGLHRLRQHGDPGGQSLFDSAAVHIQQGHIEQAWQVFKQARAAQETAAHHLGQLAVKPVTGRDIVNPRGLAAEIGLWPAPGGVSYETRWRQEFRQFVQSRGEWRPGKPLTQSSAHEPQLDRSTARDADHLSPTEHTRLEQRETAAALVRELYKHGYMAAFAGGAVRDEYRGIAPKDYDIATSATPDQVAAVFSRQGHELKLTGKQFGVVRVRIKGVDYEIATLRNDGNYTDGRRPDSVKFVASFFEDAARRDLTANAMLLDPANGVIYDFFGGRRDLDAKVLRTVGDANRRFAEDYLRMMRVPRLLSTKFTDFTVDAATVEGLRKNAARIKGVAAERVTDELRSMLTGKKPLRGLDLMMETGLMKHLLPEVVEMNGPRGAQDPVWHPEGNTWTHSRMVVENLTGSRFETMLSGLLHDIGKPGTQTVWPDGRISNHGHAALGAEMFKNIAARLKLTNLETRDVHGTILAHMDMHTVQNMPPATLKRILTLPYAQDLIALQHADALATTRPDRHARSMLNFIKAKQQEFAEANPAQRPDARPLIDGKLLQQLGIAPGPRLGQIKTEAMQAQLNGAFSTPEAARRWLAQNVPELKPN